MNRIFPILFLSIFAYCCASESPCKTCDSIPARQDSISSEIKSASCETYTKDRTHLFGSWKTHKCRNTRAALLAARSLDSTTGECTIHSGKWTDAYTDSIFTIARKVEIDHIVPLDEAYRSGAYDWSREQRVEFANDTLELAITSTHQNDAKGSKDVAEWLPQLHAKEYCIRWAQIKKKYSLVIDKKELEALGKYVAKDDLPKLGNKVNCVGVAH